MIIGESLAPHTHLEILILCILFFSVVVVGGGSRKIPRNFYGTNTIFINAFEQHQHTHTHKWNTQGFSVRNSSELKKKKKIVFQLSQTHWALSGNRNWISSNTLFFLRSFLFFTFSVVVVEKTIKWNILSSPFLAFLSLIYILFFSFLSILSFCLDSKSNQHTEIVH